MARAISPRYKSPPGVMSLASVLLCLLTAHHSPAQEIFALQPPDGQDDDLFGYSVDLSLGWANTIAVGSRMHDDPSTWAGAVYLFSALDGTLITKVSAPDAGTADFFGSSVALSEVQLVVGAPWKGNTWGSNAGGAYVFSGFDGSFFAHLLPSYLATNARFGWAVDADIATIAVGAPWDNAGALRSGRAFLFDTGSYSERSVLEAQDADDDDWFGSSVAVFGQYALVGAPGDDEAGNEAGAAYLFNTATGTELMKLLPSGPSSTAEFGSSVCLTASHAVIGAPGDDTVTTNAGAVYVFDLSGVEVAKIIEPGLNSAHLGFSVQVDSDRVIAGAIGSERAYIFGLYTGALLGTLTPSTPGNDQGWAVAIDDGLAIVSGPGGNPAGGVATAFGSHVWRQGVAPDHWYSPTTGGLTWQQAEDVALGFGAHLAAVGGTSENLWLTGTFHGDGSPLWIGYTDQVAEGTFEWVSGEAPLFEAWESGEPDDAGNADWVVVDVSSGLWRDEPGDAYSRGVMELVSGDCDGDWVPDRYEIQLSPGLDWNGDDVLDSCTSSNYCSSETNSTGDAASIGGYGTPVVAENAFTLQGWGLPLHEYGYFLTSQSTAFVPNFGGSDGNLCIGPPQYRFNDPATGGQVLNSGGTGTMSLTLDFNLLPNGVTLAPGETWYFQLWFRDVFTSNTTDGIEVMFR